MELPIFPLNGAVLFPGTSLPLNIFEERYVEMINYALSNKRLIGMIQHNEENQLYEVGCVGKIHSFNETNDGRYLISLQGEQCFRVVKELKQKYKFRMVKAEEIKGSSPEHVGFSDKQKKFLLDKYSDYINFNKINIELTEIENIEVHQLIKFIPMISPFDYIDKQALLETNNIYEFYEKLVSLLEIESTNKLFQSKVN